MIVNFRNTSWLHPAAAVALSTAIALSFTGCKNEPTAPAPIVDANAQNGGDPANANFAPAPNTQQGFVAKPSSGQPTKVLGSSQSYVPQQQSQYYPQQQQPQNYQQQPDNGQYNDDYDQAY